MYFGKAPNPTQLTIDLNPDNSVQSVVVNGEYLLYDSLRMFFANGGGDCFIISVGDYDDTISKASLLDGLKSIEEMDRPTLLVIPETVHLSDSEAGEVHAAMLAQCNKLQDRFAILDIVDGDKKITPSINPIQEFRSNVGMNNLKYGAAYYPWLRTTLPYNVDYDAIVGAAGVVDSIFNSALVLEINNIQVDFTNIVGPTNYLNIVSSRPQLGTLGNQIFDRLEYFYALNVNLLDNGSSDYSATSIHNRYVQSGSIFHGLVQQLFDFVFLALKVNNDNLPNTGWDTALIVGDFGAVFPYPMVNPTETSSNNVYGDSSHASIAAPHFFTLATKLENLIASFKSELKAARQKKTELLLEVDGVYRGIYEAIKKQGVVLPPSAAMAGIYAMVDNDRGVWKSPANVSLTAVKGPVVNVTHEDQEDLNIDSTAGKSINAIRSFTGKGTMVWGARTLAGNDNEWRYVSVRRFFNMVEESTKKATEAFVFEPNDANTWVKVRTMIENFLTLQWRAGALAGAKPDDAFFVRVGLGQTMTAEDILNGYMHVEIGMAVVRPAEFIVLKFSHKLQES